MSIPADPPPDTTRRRALAMFVNGAVALIGGVLSTLLAAFAIRPAIGSARGRERWIRAGTVGDLTPDVPIPRVLSVPRADGWYRARARETVFLVWDGAREVRALSATCTHLGCQIVWESKEKRFHCPCHGGVYDAGGRVISGPPPRPLERLDARVDDKGETILVRV
jgi:Rieske Fe-S protein